MKRKRFLTTTIFCLITLLLIVQVANAETIIPLFDNRFDAPPWSIMMVPNRLGDHINNIDVDLLSYSTDGTLKEPAFLEEPILPEINGNKWTVGPLAASPGELVGNTQDIINSLVNTDFSADELEFGNINEILTDLGFADGDINYHTVYARINIKNHHTENIEVVLTVVVHGNTGAKFWLNGSMVLPNTFGGVENKNKAHGRRIRLSPGDNDLLFKSSHALGEWNVLPFLTVSRDELAAEIEPVATQAGDSLTKSQEFVVTDSTILDEHEWSLPDDLLTDVAVAENATYFVYKPDVPKIESWGYLPYKSTITLKIPDTIDPADFDRNDLPYEYPYLMVPLPQTPAEDAEAADDILTIRAGIWKFFGNIWEVVKEDVVEAVFLESAERLFNLSKAAMWKIQAGIWGYKVVTTTYWDVSNLIDEERAAFKEIKDNLASPTTKIEDYSAWSSSDPVDQRLPRFLVMIPKPLTELKINMETYYLEQSNAVGTSAYNQLIIMKNTGLLKGNMSLFYNPGTTENGHTIRLTVPDSHSAGKNLVTLLEFWASDDTRDNSGAWNKWKGKWHDGENITEEEKDKIINGFKDYLNLWEQLEYISIDDILLNDMWQEGIDDPIVSLQLPNYTAIPRDPVSSTLTLQLQRAAASAPHARTMSLADYPPFQELAPEVQALLLNYFGETATTDRVNEMERETLPQETTLLPNYPNPFNPETWIPYQLSEPADVSLTIHDINGRIVRDLDLGHQHAGIYHNRARAAFWDGRNALGEPVASGVYFYTLKAGDFTATRKLLIRK